MTFPYQAGDKVLIGGAQLATVTYVDTVNDYFTWDAETGTGALNRCGGHISNTRIEYQGGYKPASTDGVERDIFGQPITDGSNSGDGPEPDVADADVPASEGGPGSDAVELPLPEGAKNVKA